MTDDKNSNSDSNSRSSDNSSSDSSSNGSTKTKLSEPKQRMIALGIFLAICVGWFLWLPFTHDPNSIVKEGIQLHSGYFFGATPEEIREFESVANGAFKVGNSCLSYTKSAIPIACAKDEDGKLSIFLPVERSGKKIKRFLTGREFLEKLRIESRLKNFKTIAVIWQTKLYSNRYGAKRPALVIQMESRKGRDGVACLPYSIDKDGNVNYERMREVELKPLEILFTRDTSVKPMFEWIPPAKTDSLPVDSSEFKSDDGTNGAPGKSDQ